MSPVTSVSETATVDEAMHQMLAADISYILVQPNDSGSWGIMTKRDVVTKIVGANKSTSNVSVGEITTRPLITVPADAGLRAVSMVLSENNIRRVVVEAKGIPVGVVSDTDLFEVVQEFGWYPEE
ncbi:MAG: CBS domain-containing protein [Arenicellales bacterium]|nr:CBS domain-containing protein [Arenicellales bacterium]